jgi:hypothetical protein
MFCVEQFMIHQSLDYPYRNAAILAHLIADHPYIHTSAATFICRECKAKWIKSAIWADKAMGEHEPNCIVPIAENALRELGEIDEG